MLQIIAYLYTYQALNYLSIGNISKAQSSLDNLDVAGIWIDKQKMLVGGMKDLTKKYIKQDKIRLEKLGINDIESINAMSKYSRKIPDSFGSPVAYYLKSVLELSKKDYTASLDSLNKAHEYTAGNSYLDNSISEAYRAKQSKKPFSMGMGRIVVIYEQGLVNMRDQIKAPLKLGKIGKRNFDFPVYSTNYQFIGPKTISISQNGKEITKTHTQTLYDGTLFAMKSLTESYANIIVQDVVIEIIKHNYDKGFALGGLLGSHLKINLSKTEPKRADMRSWLLLPNSVDLYEKQIDSGKYSLNINNIRQNIEVKQGKTTLLWVVNIGEFKKVNYFII